MNLNKAQKKAVFELQQNTLLTASPGSGKTRTLVARAIHKLESIPKFKTIALITYTNAGSDEIASRLVTDKDIFIGTIHSFCLEFILRPFGWIYSWKRPRVISYEQKQQFFEKNEDINLESSYGQNKFIEIGKLQKKIDGTIDTNIAWEHEISITNLANRYYDYLDKIGVIDFNEILYRSYRIISQNQFIARSLSSKFYEILVDEFQDTNLYQYEILRIINGNGNCTFFMVGDEKQRIFSFAGAIENAFGKAKADFKAKHEELSETYRSSNDIVNAYTKLFKNHPNINNQSDCKGFKNGVHFIKTGSKNNNRILKQLIDELVKVNIDLSEIAILSTSWYTAFPTSKYLRKHYPIVGLGALPHKSISNSSISLLQALSMYYINPDIRKLRRIKRNIDMHLLENGLLFSDKQIHRNTNKLIQRFLKISSSKSLAEGLIEIEKIFNEAFTIKHSAFEEIAESISEKDKVGWTIRRYVSTLAGVDGITSNTIHKVKGLEFEAVILNGMNNRKIPYQKCIDRKKWEYEKLTKESREAGRNLFYVALSRAKKYLFILHSWKPSLFIDMIK